MYNRKCVHNNAEHQRHGKNAQGEQGEALVVTQGRVDRKRDQRGAGIPGSQSCHTIWKLLSASVHIRSLKSTMRTFTYIYSPRLSDA